MDKLKFYQFIGNSQVWIKRKQLDKAIDELEKALECDPVDEIRTKLKNKIKKLREWNNVVIKNKTGLFAKDKYDEDCRTDYKSEECEECGLPFDPTSFFSGYTIDWSYAEYNECLCEDCYMKKFEENYYYARWGGYDENKESTDERWEPHDSDNLDCEGKDYD